jgi:hypothetical protein
LDAGGCDGWNADEPSTAGMGAHERRLRRRRDARARLRGGTAIIAGRVIDPMGPAAGVEIRAYEVAFDDHVELGTVRTTEPPLVSYGLSGQHVGWIVDDAAQCAEIDRRLLLASEIATRLSGTGVTQRHRTSWTEFPVDIVDDLARGTPCWYEERDDGEQTPMRCPFTDRDPDTWLGVDLLRVFVDLGSEQVISSIRVMDLHGPSQYRVLVSTDDATYTAVGEYWVPQDIIVDFQRRKPHATSRSKASARRPR